MTEIDIRAAAGFLRKARLEEALREAGSALDRVRDGSGPGSEWLGWRRVLRRPDEELLNRIERHAASVRKRADMLVVCGIGGSWLGTRAVLEALRGTLPGESPEILYAGHHMGGAALDRLIERLERPQKDGSRPEVFLNVISKSGTTLETALAFRVLRAWFDRRYGADAPSRIVVTTAPEGGVLNELVTAAGYEKYEIPDDVGGRFSVLTPVGLFPLAFAGIDVRSLFSGAVSAYRALESDAKHLLDYAAVRYLFHEEGKAIDVIGSFEPELEAFTGWIQQLLGESEGKEGKGLFPVPVTYSTDLHSIGQMVQQGRRNLIETLLVIDEPLSGRTAGGAEGADDGLSYLNGKPFHEINRQALAGTVEAHLKGGVPVIRVLPGRLDAFSLGGLIYFYELFTAVYVYMLGLNPFDQPGVEAYKREMYRNLGRD